MRETVERGGAALVATHDLARGAGVLERVLVLDAGLIVDEAPPVAERAAAGREAVAP